MTVSELAGRSGVPASTVRFYGREGLLPARRSPSGYRLYDEGAVDRLAFIATAKGLGLTLPEIRRLLAPWQHGACPDVRHELVPLVERHLAETRERGLELTAFADHLVRARAQLEVLDRQGPCGPSCTRLGQTGAVVGPTPPALPVAGPGTEVIACSLDAADREDRAAHWRTVLGAVVERVAIPGGVRLTVDTDRVALGELAELAAAEARCCPFLDLALHLGPPVRLEVRAPDEARVLVHELFGEPAA
ncbi:MerR family transcriptional regulator [Actinomycetospora straminea]|uniref:HTH merR-type domain-containing protein n=1 Tax=Actinomycetospora straminea TaxID=663607 RepID=A0ABP9DXM7_9PSEU|nr:MerR family transcriptional regulator [Actinomycetospora straminea]MDD7934217.1 MerR family transcriptional regulator [Actinomycetospora straminea]